MNIRLAALAVALVASFSGTAFADIVDVTYTGTINSVYDPNHLVGPNVAVGQSYVATYRFDTGVGNTYSDPTESYAYGGSYYGLANPFLSGSVTINGSTTFTLPTTTISEIFGQNTSGPFAEQYAIARNYVQNVSDAYVETYIYNNSAISAIPASITTPFSYTS